jgi:hypothetical protein
VVETRIKVLWKCGKFGMGEVTEFIRSFRAWFCDVQRWWDAESWREG